MRSPGWSGSCTRDASTTARIFGNRPRGSRAALHFHEDAAGLFADLRLQGDWQRLPVNSRAERAALMRALALLSPRETASVSGRAASDGRAAPPDDA